MKVMTLAELARMPEGTIYSDADDRRKLCSLMRKGSGPEGFEDTCFPFSHWDILNDLDSGPSDQYLGGHRKDAVFHVYEVTDLMTLIGSLADGLKVASANPLTPEALPRIVTVTVTVVDPKE